MNSRFILFIVLAINCHSVYAKSDIKLLTDWVPFELVKNHIVVDVKINGTTIKAVFDTGANVSAINRDTAKRLHLRRSKQRVRVRGVVGSKTMTMTKKTNVELPGVFDKSIKFVMYKDLGSIDAIIGMDFLAFPLIQFDYLNNRLRFATPNVFQFDHAAAIPLRAEGLSYFINVKIDGIPLEMLLDTGNAGQVLVSISNIKNSTLGTIINKNELITKKNVGLHNSEMQYYENVSDDFKIGPHVLENVRYMVASEETSLAHSASILGYDILKNFIVTLDMVNMNLYLTSQ